MIIEANRHWQYTDTDNNLLLPWYTLPALEWLKQHDVSKWRVFEYGCGYSTIWWRVNCDRVESVESNKVWAIAMGAAFRDEKNLYITYCSEAPLFYEDYNPGDPNYDCIIVDGDHRYECTEFCLPYLKPCGYLIIDNWEEPGGYDCEKIKELLKDWDCVVHQQPNHSNWRTAIFTKQNL